MGASVKERMRALGLFSLNREDSVGSYQCVFPDWVGKNRKDRSRLLSVVSHESIRGNGHRLK